MFPESELFVRGHPTLSEQLVAPGTSRGCHVVVGFEANTDAAMGVSGGSEWMTAMRALDFERAWKISDDDVAHAPVAKHAGPRHLQRIWRCEPLRNARVLVRCYHGLGDTIQFIRFAAQLRTIAREVIVWAQPELQSIVSKVAGVDRVLPLHDGTPEAEFDVDIEIMELPHALRVTAASLGDYVPYLHCVPDQAAASTGPLAVGLVWEAGGWDLRRSIALRELAPLAMIEGAQLYSLRPGADFGWFSMLDRSSRSIDTLAARIAGLDVVITVDTMTAHLAGALGLNVWTLLPTGCDWRWGNVGYRTPWYPTMRLYRQRSPHDWSAPVAEIATELRRMRIVRART